MRAIAVITGVFALMVLTTGNANADNYDSRYKESHPWIKLWSKRDRSIYPSVKVAGNIFNVSPGLMLTIVGREGGNVNPSKLRRSLCQYNGIGWNITGGSAAFGPFQFMLSYRGACFNPRSWGTFGSYDDAAFRAAKSRGYAIPYRFKHPASNVGQSITAAYMLANGGLSHWCASMC